jgi:hypothetical protein
LPATLATSPIPVHPGDFAWNEEALANYGHDALKKTRDTAMYLIEQRYGQPPVRSYFAGGSTGGREALAVVQQWPKDFSRCNRALSGLQRRRTGFAVWPHYPARWLRQAPIPA